MNYPGETLERENASNANTLSSALREAGINDALIAKKLKDLLEAKHQRWNPKRNSWDEFDDCDTQLAATREIVRLFGGYASEGEDHGVVWINDVFAPRDSSRSEGRERSERCQADSEASGKAPECCTRRKLHGL